MSEHAHPTSRARHEQHSDERTRVEALRRQERHAARVAHERALRTMVQPHEPHHRTPVVTPVSPRQQLDSLPAPGGEDHTGFLEGGIC